MFEFNEGVHLKDTAIWFDATKRKKMSFITNALSTTFLNHEKIIATPQTCRLLKSKIKKVDVLPCPYNHIFNLGKTEVELLPSGYIPGSSQVLLYKNNKKILYVSDFKLDQLALATPIEITQCDYLIMKSTFGVKKYIFQSSEVAIIPIVEFINNCIENDLLPVLLTDRLGNSQEIIRLISEKGFDIFVHESIHRFNIIYEELGYLMPRYSRLRNAVDPVRGVIIAPVEFKMDKILLSQQNIVYAVISEIALDDTGHHITETGTEYCFPFSVRAGFDEMLKFVEVVNPAEVYVTGNYDAEFSGELGKKGYNAHILNNPEQLNLI